MNYVEKCAYFVGTASAFFVILLAHYLLSKPASPASSDETVNTAPQPQSHCEAAQQRNTFGSAVTEAQSMTNPSEPDSCLPHPDDGEIRQRPSRPQSTANNDCDSDAFLVKRIVVRPSMTYRPRGALARAVYEKVHNDQYLDGYDMQLWYTLQKPLAEKRFQRKFVPMLQPDARTLTWLDTARLLSSNFWLQLWHLLARMVLTTFMTQTDANGLLKRGSMYILSEEQFGRLLRAGGFRANGQSVGEPLNVLDIGAGDGEVTEYLIKSLQHLDGDVGKRSDASKEAIPNGQKPQKPDVRVYATEYSFTMRNRLQKKNYIVIDKIQDVRNVDLIACLNVLDRCADPHQIMADIRETLSDDGRVIVALVLPYSHYVESNSSHMPLRTLLPHWPSTTHKMPFDAEAVSFFEQLEQMGFNIEAWTKAPYLCEGDMRQSFYFLTDVVVVLSKRIDAPPAATDGDATSAVPSNSTSK